jgi:cytochrome c peroxidase
VHTRSVGEEPAALALDATGGRIYVMTMTGQDIVTLAADSGRVLSRTKFTRDPTPRHTARGRYLFQTATDRRLTKDQWMSCAACHPDGHADGRQWDFGHGPLDTAPLLGIVHTAPLHPSGHLDEIQDTYDFTRRVMAGQWFVPRDVMHDYLGPSNARLCEDLDALAAYIHSLEFRNPLAPSVHDQLRFARGREVFFSPTTGCARCHPPPYYTDSGQRDAGGTFVRHDVGTSRPGGPAPLDTPTLLGLSRSEPYLHHGGAQTLEDVISTFNRDDRHGRTSHLDADDRRALATFLKYLTIE